MKKNIVMISHDYLPNIGGVANYVYEMSKELAQIGHQVTIITKYDSFSTRTIINYQDKLRIIRVPIPPIKKIDDYYYIKRMQKCITQLEEEETVDILNWHTLNKDARVMKTLNVKALEVYTNHLSWFRMLYQENNYKKIYSLMREPDVIICPSKETEKMSKDLFKKSQIFYIPNGVDNDKFYNDPTMSNQIRKNMGISKNELVILTTSRMEPVKGMNFVIEAIPEVLKKYSNVTFVLVGDGSKLEQYKKEIYKQVTDVEKVIFTGRLNNLEINEMLNISDIYVHPSLMEGCSLSILEAMASSKPIIACNVGGNPDILLNNSGILIDPGSTDKLKEALYKVINYSDQERKDIGNRGRDLVNTKFNWKILAKELEKRYEQALL